MTTRDFRPATRFAPLAIALAAVALAAPALAQTADGEWYGILYLQQSFPKQTNTNLQIEQINQMFGVDFDTWDDVPNLNLGLQALKRVSPRWRVGLQVDYSSGSVKGDATVDTAGLAFLGIPDVGPATLSFEQKYSTYADLYAIAHYLPCQTCRNFVPFVLGGVGIAYEKDTTNLSLKNDYVDEYLRVENDGYFPSYTAGLGFDWYFGNAHQWFLNIGAAYVWGRMTNTVPAEGGLAPAPEVTADTDVSGPNYWIGIGRRF